MPATQQLLCFVHHRCRARLMTSRRRAARAAQITGGPTPGNPTSKAPPLQQVQEALALPPCDALGHCPEDHQQQYHGYDDDEQVVRGHRGAGAACIRVRAAGAAAGAVTRRRGQHCRKRGGLGVGDGAWGRVCGGGGGGGGSWGTKDEAEFETVGSYTISNCFGPGLWKFRAFAKGHAVEPLLFPSSEGALAGPQHRPVPKSVQHSTDAEAQPGMSVRTDSQGPRTAL